MFPLGRCLNNAFADHNYEAVTLTEWNAAGGNAGSMEASLRSFSSTGTSHTRAWRQRRAIRLSLTSFVLGAAPYEHAC